MTDLRKERKAPKHLTRGEKINIEEANKSNRDQNEIMTRYYEDDSRNIKSADKDRSNHQKK